MSVKLQIQYVTWQSQELNWRQVEVIEGYLLTQDSLKSHEGAVHARSEGSGCRSTNWRSRQLKSREDNESNRRVPPAVVKTEARRDSALK